VRTLGPKTDLTNCFVDCFAAFPTINVHPMSSRIGAAGGLGFLGCDARIVGDNGTGLGIGVASRL
jgi:hypothetical protein